MSRYLRKLSGLLAAGIQRIARPTLITLGIADLQPPRVLPPYLPPPEELPVFVAAAGTEPPGLTRLYEILREF
jgi:hypothetical protein